jgi:hypothetical protein
MPHNANVARFYKPGTTLEIGRTKIMIMAHPKAI